ncbi:hypothetical protein [Mycobacterium sp.]|uniref:hypothetical protein n=1 Tax=Mycobacterium sp. TaxID=1785 RepID=UPI003F9E00EF
MHPAIANARARRAGLHGRPIDDPDRVNAERDLAAAKIANYIEKVVAQARPFTREQVDQLRVLLEPARRDLANARPGGGDAA